MSARIVLVIPVLLIFSACSHSSNPSPNSPTTPTSPPNPLDTATTVTTGTDSSYWQIVSNANALAFSDIWFTDTLHGFAAGSNGYIYLSADGGTTWTQSAQLEPSSSGQLGIQTLFFSGSQIGYAVGLMHIAVTANGGQSWTIKSRPDLPITGAQRWPSLQFITPTTGFFSAGQKLWRTDDSADHWTPIEIDSVGSFYFFGTNNGVSFAYPNRINRTLDGATWQNTAILPNSSSGMPFTYMQFSNDQTGWFTDLNRISTTSNGGVSWKAVFQPYPDIITDFQVLSGQTVYLAGVNHLYKTMDGGTTWQREYTLSSNLASQGGLIAIFFLDDHHGWATGGNGVVLRYRH